MAHNTILVDTMIVIEAMDTGCWNAITGQRKVCDRAAVRAAHALGWLGRVVSLEAVAASVGARPSRSFKRQYTERFLSAWRTDLRLEGEL